MSSVNGHVAKVEHSSSTYFRFAIFVNFVISKRMLKMEGINSHHLLGSKKVYEGVV